MSFFVCVSFCTISIPIVAIIVEQDQIFSNAVNTASDAFIKCCYRYHVNEQTHCARIVLTCSK